MRCKSQSQALQGPFLWTRGIAAREFLHYLENNGIDAEPLLSKAQLARGQLVHDLSGISFAAQNRFLDLAALETQDSLLALHVAAQMDLRDAGILFYLAAAASTVTEALKDLVRYAGATSEAVRFEISRQNDEAVLTAHPLLALDEACPQFPEFCAPGLIRYCVT